MTCNALSGKMRSEGAPGSRTGTFSYTPFAFIRWKEDGGKENSKTSPLSLLVQSLSLSSPTLSSKNGTKIGLNSNRRTELEIRNEQ